MFAINAAAKPHINFVSFSLKVICMRVGTAEADVFGDGSVTLVSTPGHTPGHQSLLVHLKNSGFIILSGDVVHSEENFEKNRVPSLNTNNAESIASMQKIT